MNRLLNSLHKNVNRFDIDYAIHYPAEIYVALMKLLDYSCEVIDIIIFKHVEK